MCLSTDIKFNVQIVHYTDCVKIDHLSNDVCYDCDKHRNVTLFGDPFNRVVIKSERLQTSIEFNLVQGCEGNNEDVVGSGSWGI